MTILLAYVNDLTKVSDNILRKGRKMSKKPHFFLVSIGVFFLSGCLSQMHVHEQSTAPQMATKTAIQNSLDHITEGLKSYEMGNFETTKEQFDCALDILMTTDLPDSFKNFRMLQLGLSNGNEDYNLEKIYKKVYRPDEPVLTERDTDSSLSNETAVLPETIPVEISETDTHVPQQEIEAVTTRTLVIKEIKRLAAEFGENDFTIPEPFLNKVEGYIHLYKTKEKNRFQAAMVRGEQYIPMIKSILAKKGLPLDLTYMAMVESRFNPRARSSAGARGLWQFMKATAIRYNLVVNRYYDERLDPVKSTIAASEYISDLVMVFGSRSFMLAMAAFNAGGGRVMHSLQKIEDIKQRSFWDLVTRGYLKRETCEYVPKIIATTIIGSNPQHFGFNELKTIDIPEHDVVKLTTPKKLSMLASLCEISLPELFELNPDINQNNIYTPSGPNISEYQLFIPKGKQHILEEKLAMIEREEQGENIYCFTEDPQNPPRKTRYCTYHVKKGNTLKQISDLFNKPEKVIVSWNRFLEKRKPQQGDVIFIYDPDENLKKSIHKVESGESLWIIGKYYNIEPSLIATWNGIEKNRIFPGQKLAIYQFQEGNIASSRIRKKTTDTLKGKHTYNVKKGDCLSEIARSFDIGVEDLMRWNNLKDGIIFPGQKLTVSQFQESERASSKTKKITAGTPKTKHTYNVKKGDCLSEIARSFDIGVEDLMRWNNLKDGIIFPGQKLTIYQFQESERASSKTKKITADTPQEKYTYNVKKGDCLSEIAQLFDIKVDDIRRWNSLKGNRIEAGQDLIIYSRQIKD